MSYDEMTNLIGVNADCLMNVLSFLQEKMPEQETVGFIEHTKGCRECQEYIEIVSVLMANREEILAQLRKGGLVGKSKRR